MFGRKNGRRVEARRVPSSSSKNKKNTNDLYCGGCCQSLANCCVSCGAHGWFLTLFCGYVLVSSLPRILIILDFIITVALYFQYNYNSVSGFAKQNWIQNSYTFKHSTFDIVIISFIRCIILFICFAYRYQREGFRKNIYISFTVVILTSIYLIIKLYFNKNDIVIFSLSFVWIECIFFFMVRRRRIRYAPNIYAQRDRKIMKPTKQSKYYRIDDDELGPNRNSKLSDYTPELSPLNPLNNPHVANIPIYNNNNHHHNNTPPPFINDSYLDDFSDKKKAKKKESDEEKQKQIQVQQPQLQLHNSSNFSIEHSISATIPDSEFSQNELPLRTENSEFFIIDGVAIHYCLERNYNIDHNNHNHNMDECVWIILLHGFGGGVFSWKRSMPLMLNCMENNILGILAFDRVGFGLTERPVTNTNTHTNTSSAESESDEDENKTENKNDIDPYSIDFSLKIIKTFLDKFSMKKCVFMGHSTGGLIANLFAYHYPSYVSGGGLILISPTSGMPLFVRSILKTSLGKGIILSLVRSEIGQVTLHQAWHNPSAIPYHVIASYKQVLKLKNWNESILEMAKVKPYCNSNKYHKILSQITCPVWLLHGDDDKLVTFRESCNLSSYFKYCFGPIKLKDCGHIPHEEIPNKFVDIIKNIIEKELKEFNLNKNNSSYQLQIQSQLNGNNNNNIINKGAQKLKEIILNIGRNDSNNESGNIDSNQLTKTQNVINTMKLNGRTETETEKEKENENKHEKQPETSTPTTNINNNKLTESSALLSD